jgi:uncharacterized protein (DUF58 family)
MNILEVRKIVGRIKAQLFKKSNNYSIGMLKSHFRGSGLQFKEHRQYTHGDDVRFIDWKILAKTGNPYIKTFEEERNVQIAVVIDAGPSMFYGWDKVSKLQAALEITCMLYLLAAETNDSIHAIILSNEIIDVPSGNGEKGITQLIASLSRAKLIDESGKLNLEWEPYEINLEEREKAIKKHLSRNREVVILSDWVDLLEGKNFERVVFNRRSHCFRLLAPIDVEGGVNLTLRTLGPAGRGGAVKTFSGRGSLVRGDIKKIRNLNIDDRYLDNFIREMI